MVPYGGGMEHRSAVLASLLLFASSAAASAPADPDHGLARAYFRHLTPDPLVIESGGPPARDIIWIVVDALRPDHLGAYGYQKPTSPFLDALAKDSLVFLHAYANAPWTRPSTATMLTGLYPSGHQTQTDKSRLPGGLRTIAQDLKALGYATAAVVANGNASSIAGLDRGFDHYVDSRTHFKRLPAAGEVYAEALRWLKNRPDRKKPFFLFLFLVDPHDPYRAPPEYEKEWLGKLAPPARRTPHWEYKNNYPAAEREAMIAVYDAAIRFTDDQTRRFFGELEKLGLKDRVNLVLTADHGDGFGEHGYYLHAHHHYDEIIRVPLLVRIPSWGSRGHVFHPAQHVDLLPTLVTLAGGQPRADLPGRELRQMLEEPVDRGRRILSEYNAFGIRRSSMFDLRHRVILQLPADKETFLRHIPRPELLPSVSFDREVLHVYDRVADPLDRKNLAPAKVPEEARPLIHALRRWMTATPRSNEGEREGAVIPAGIKENLRSLGYVQ